MILGQLASAATWFTNFHAGTRKLLSCRLLAASAQTTNKIHLNYMLDKLILQTVLFQGLRGEEREWVHEK